MSKSSTDTHCAQGHSWAVETTGYTKRGWKFCRICRRDHGRAAAARRTESRKEELREYTRVWRAENREGTRTRAKRAYNQVREVIESFKDAPCLDCGARYPHYVMDFDHRDPAQKTRNVGQCRSVSEVLAEIAKCDLVCANCHRIRTWKDVQRWAE